MLAFMSSETYICKFIASKINKVLAEIGNSKREDKKFDLLLFHLIEMLGHKYKNRLVCPSLLEF